MAAALRDPQGPIHKQRTVEVELARCSKVGRSPAEMPGLEGHYFPDETYWK
jgi:hypothetical protein